MMSVSGTKRARPVTEYSGIPEIFQSFRFATAMIRVTAHLWFKPQRMTTWRFRCFGLA